MSLPSPKGRPSCPSTKTTISFPSFCSEPSAHAGGSTDPVDASAWLAAVVRTAASQESQPAQAAAGDMQIVPLPPETHGDAPLPGAFRPMGNSAQGGQARVIKALSLETGHVAALKCFDDRNAAAREWAILQNHRNDETVPLPMAFGTLLCQGAQRSERGQFAIAMEYIEGPTLLQLMGDRAFMENLTVERALRIVAPIARFCANSCQSRSHDVHCDIKPANIIVQNPETGTGARLIDFGVALHKNSEASAGATLGYSAPELNAERFPKARGRHNDHRVDTYSIAATLYALLQGGTPPIADSGWVATENEAAELPSEFAFDATRLKHDEALAERLAQQAGAYIATVPCAVQLGAADIRHAVQRAFAARDQRLALALCRCLSHDQSARLMPTELESALFLDASHYEADLFNRAAVECLRAANPHESHADAASFDGPIAEGTFAQALAAFNRGRYPEAVPVLRHLASKGDVSAMYYLACCIRDGLGCAPNHDEMVYLMSRAAESGNVLAQNALGRLYFSGEGVARDEAAGMRLICLSAQDVEGEKTGFPPAKAWLAQRGIDAARWLEEHNG